MKSLFLFSTKVQYFLGEIPVIGLLIASILKNEDSKTALKLYPLIIGSAAAAIFIALYFFRAVTISYSEIKHIGLFSRREKAMINAGKTLIINEMKRGKIKVVLFGNNGLPPIYSDPETEEVKPVDIHLFDGKVLGKSYTAKRILRFFSLSPDEAEALWNTDTEITLDFLKATSTTSETGREISLYFTKTV